MSFERVPFDAQRRCLATASANKIFRHFLERTKNRREKEISSKNFHDEQKKEKVFLCDSSMIHRRLKRLFFDVSLIFDFYSNGSFSFSGHRLTFDMMSNSSSQIQQPLSTITNQREKNNETLVTKSPLEFTWTFWYIKPEKRLSWEQSLINLIDVSFVEDFWATFNHLAAPSRLSQMKTNSDYYFFKKGGSLKKKTDFPL